MNPTALRLLLPLLCQVPASRPATQPASRPASQPEVLAGLPAAARRDYQTLRGVERFTDAAIGDGGETPEWVHAFRRLLAQPQAAAVFRQLLQDATLPGQMYALCGLYWTDQPAFRAALPGYARMTTEIETQTGCCVSRMAVRELVASDHPRVVRLERPDQTIREWADQHDPQHKGVHYDIQGGAWPYVLKTDRW